MKKKSSLGKREALPKKRPAKKSQLAVQQHTANGLAKRSAKPASAVAGNGTSLVRTLKVPSQTVPTVGLFRRHLTLKIGDSEYCCNRSFCEEANRILPAGKYVTCLVEGRAFPSVGTFRLEFVNLDGRYKGRVVSMTSRISPKKEWGQTREMLKDLGLLSVVQEAMAGKVGPLVTEGIVCLCDVATIWYEGDDGDEVEDNEIRSVEVLRIERPAEDAA